MTGVLTAAVVLVGGLGLLNLMVTFGVVRRLREHTATLEGLVRAGAATGAGFTGDVPVPGRPVGAFDATTTDGEPLSLARLAAHTAVVFLAPECGTCRAQLPDLVGWAGSRERERVVVVVDGSVSDTGDLVGPLEPVARVIVDGAGTPVARAFGVTAYPAACVVSDGTVVAAAAEFGRLPVPAFPRAAGSPVRQIRR